MSRAKERLREMVQTWARVGAPNVSPLIEHEGGEVVWPTQTLQSQVFNAEGPRPIAFAQIEPLIPLLAWLLGDVMTKKLDAILAEEADDSAALSIPDRQRQIATVQSDLLAVERDLCWFVWAGLDAQLPVWFAEGISAMAIVGAELITPLAVNGGGSTPGERSSYEIVGPARR